MLYIYVPALIAALLTDTAKSIERLQGSAEYFSAWESHFNGSIPAGELQFPYFLVCFLSCHHNHQYYVYFTPIELTPKSGLDGRFPRVWSPEEKEVWQANWFQRDDQFERPWWGCWSMIVLLWHSLLSKFHATPSLMIVPLFSSV